MGNKGDGKIKDMMYSIRKPPLPKVGYFLGSSTKKKSNFNSSEFLGKSIQSSGGGFFRESISLKTNSAGGSIIQRVSPFPLCGKCNQKYPRDCSITMDRCYIYRWKGYEWKDYKHLRTCCFH
jgi:hypothetical protein